MNILVVDDHPLYRDALARIASQVFPEAAICVAGDCVTALQRLRDMGSADLVLLDLAMPGAGGMEALARIRNDFPGVRVVMVSATERRADVVSCLQSGASGFIPKSAATEVLAAALKLIGEGGTYLPALLLDGVEPAARTVSSRSAPGSDQGSAASGVLTPRELQTLAALCGGRSNKAIANELGISEATVRTHLTTVFRILGVSNRTQAARAARQRGLVPDE
ncbi:MAG: response regulator transcription factor [Betaproteobacteria bacterium]|nr:response regulator transcription factor [Betaproteobacteria bacterium]